MKYQILKPTKCHVNNHVWIFTSGSSTTEPPLNMQCDCEKYTWEAMKAITDEKKEKEKEGNE